MIKFEQVEQNPYAPKGSVWYEDEHGPSVHVKKPDGGELTFTGAKAAYFKHMRWKDASEFKAMDDVIEKTPDNLTGFDLVEKGHTNVLPPNRVRMNWEKFHFGSALMRKYGIQDKVIVMVDEEKNQVAFRKPKEGEEDNAYSVNTNHISCSTLRHYVDHEMKSKKEYKVQEEEDKFIIQL